MDNNSKKRIEMLEQYILEDSEDIFSKYALALEYIKGENTEGATSLLKGIIQKHPDYLAAYYQLGKLYEQSNSAEAKKVYESGIAVAQRQKNFKTLNEIQAALDSMDG
jgi:Tfp pilus assembly protein PilF